MPDLVFMVVNMPGINGAACRKIVQKNVMLKFARQAGRVGNAAVYHKKSFENQRGNYTDSRICSDGLLSGLKRIVRYNKLQVETICNNTL